MQNNAKVAVAILAVVAGFSVWQFYGAINGALPGLPVAVVTPDPTAPDNDVDQDGLSNEEESYWNTDPVDPDTDGDGFKDGEEVASSHDPLIPGPDDKIIANDSPQNITKKISGLILAGLYEGSLKPDNQNYNNSSSQIVDEIVSQSKVNSSLSEGIRPLRTTGDSPGSVAQYAKSISPILKTAVTDIPKQFLDIARNLDTERTEQLLSKQVSSIAQYVSVLEALPVPASWVGTHTNLVVTLKKIGKNYTLLQTRDDPLQTLSSVATLVNLIFTDVTDSMRAYSRIYVR